MKEAGHLWQMPQEGSRGSATINPTCVSSWVFSVVLEEQAVGSSCSSAQPWHDHLSYPVLLLVLFRRVDSRKGNFAMEATLQWASPSSQLAGLWSANEMLTPKEQRQQRIWLHPTTRSSTCLLPQAWEASPLPSLQSCCCHPSLSTAIPAINLGFTGTPFISYLK